MIEVTKLHTLTGHTDAIYTLEQGLRPNVIYSAGADGHLVEWDLDAPENGRSIAKVNASIYALSLNKDASAMIVGQNFDGVHYIDIESKEAVGSVNCTTAAIFDIQYHKGHIYIGTGDGTLIVLDYEKRVIVQKLKLSEQSLRTLYVMADLGVIVAGFSDNSFKVINLIDYNVEVEQKGHENSVFCVQPSFDNQYLLTGSRDAHLKYWDVNNGFEMAESIVAHMYAINHISFRHDGKYMATASMDKTIKIWDFEARKLLKVIDKARHNGHRSSVNKLLWTNHHDLLVSCSDDRSLGVWNINFDK